MLYNFVHIKNYGNSAVSGGNIFFDDDDRLRFLFMIIYLQGKKTFPQINRHIAKHRLTGNFGVKEKKEKEIIATKLIDLVSFCLTTNQFDLIAREKIVGGVAQYIQKIQNGYTKYFNQKYNRGGHLFAGPYKLVALNNPDEFLRLSTHLHKKPSVLPNWRSRVDNYPWSSYQDYLIKNRWGNTLLSLEPILEKFLDATEYKKFVESLSTDNLFDK